MKTSGHVYKFMTESISARYGLFGGPYCSLATHNRRRYRYEAAAVKRAAITPCELVRHFTINVLKTAYFTWCLILGGLFALQFLIEAVTKTLGWSGDNQFLPLYFHRLLELTANALGLHVAAGGDAIPWYLSVYSVVSFLVLFGPAIAVAVMIVITVLLVTAAIAVAMISLALYVLYVGVMSVFIAIAGDANDRRLVLEYFHDLVHVSGGHDRSLPAYRVLATKILRYRLSALRLPRLFTVVTSKIRCLTISKSSICKPIEFTED